MDRRRLPDRLAHHERLQLPPVEVRHDSQPHLPTRPALAAALATNSGDDLADIAPLKSRFSFGR